MLARIQESEAEGETHLNVIESSDPSGYFTRTCVGNVIAPGAFDKDGTCFIIDNVEQGSHD